MDMVYTLAQMEEVAQSLMKKFGTQSVWAFHAPMGAGKTTLITALCKIVGVEDRVNSPTFAIMNEYQGLGKVIYHMDWYRLENEGDAQRAGVEMAIADSDYCFIEWPEKAINLIPSDALHIEIEILDPEHRRIFIP
ncbi:MAG: tRNA (adenosine(37)-N6)-threonylcarbamoyltransferase complex ATPase subunit type 1 TsaE [Chitinophagaceae bacterium]|nr:tRNA (adenosine(37)-N6)-threonylcarbamoyltransferase complex ATPase subunit type 1 TsaE [Chitinophagaceae bacterium]